MDCIFELHLICMELKLHIVPGKMSAVKTDIYHQGRNILELHTPIIVALPQDGKMDLKHLKILQLAVISLKTTDWLSILCTLAGYTPPAQHGSPVCYSSYQDRLPSECSR